MSTTFIVNNGGSIVAPNHVRTHMPAGSKFIIGGDKNSQGPQEFGFEKRHIEQHLGSGYISTYVERTMNEGMVNKDILIENVPGVKRADPISHSDAETARVTTSNIDGSDAMQVGGPNAATPGPGVTTIDSASQLGRDVNDNKDAAGMAKSLWGFDPDALRGHNLDAMNVMIVERDSSIAPFEVADEARAWLSQDYRAPVTPSQAARVAQG